jgi:hypothetical protein
MTRRLNIWIANPTVRLLAVLSISILLAACGPGGGDGNGGY